MIGTPLRVDESEKLEGAFIEQIITWTVDADVQKQILNAALPQVWNDQLLEYLPTVMPKK